MTRDGGWCVSSAGQRVGGDLAAGADAPAGAGSGMGVRAIAGVAFTSEDRVLDVIRSSASAVSALWTGAGGRSPECALARRRPRRVTVIDW